MKSGRNKIIICVLAAVLSMGIKFLDDKIINKAQKEFEYNFTHGNFNFTNTTRDFHPDENKICFVPNDNETRKGTALISYRQIYNQGIYRDADGVESIGVYSGRKANAESTIIIQFVGYTNGGSADLQFHCVGKDVSVTLDEVPMMHCIPISISKKRTIGDFIISIISADSSINIDTLLVINYDKEYRVEDLLIGEYLYE